MALVWDYYAIKRNENNGNDTQLYLKAFNSLSQKFLNISSPYFEPSGNERLTKDGQFIVDILKKYDGHHIYMELLAIVEAYHKAYFEAFTRILADWQRNITTGTIAASNTFCGNSKAII